MKLKKNINWGRLAKYLDQELDTKDLQQFEKMVQTDPDYKEILSKVQDIWNSTKIKNDMIDVNTDSAWEKLKSRIDQSKTESVPDNYPLYITRKSILPWALRIAAVIVITAGLSYGFFRIFIFQAGEASNRFIAHSKSNQTLQTTLPDGSEVHLKSNSKIRYKEKKNGTREIVLKGETFFNVIHNPDKPFIVQTKSASITVIGTSFSVEVDQNNKRVNVFVESGYVSFSNRLKKEQSLLIEPGYMGTLTESGLEKKENMNINYLAWKTGKLEFHETRIEDVIHDLNHTYDKNIVFGNTKISDCRFTATFIDQPVDTILEVLKTAFNMEIEYSKSNIILWGSGCE